MLRLASDADVPGPVIRGLRRREPTLDLVRAQEVGLRTADDPAILAWAASEGRVLVTRDKTTMSVHAYDRVGHGLPMPGVLVLRNRLTFGEAIEEILTAAICYLEDELRDRVIFLPL